MANNTYSTENQILVAIDIAKSQHEVLICWPNGETKQLKVKSNSFEYNQFANVTIHHPQAFPDDVQVISI